MIHSTTCYTLTCDCCGRQHETGEGFTCYTDDIDGSLIRGDAECSDWMRLGDLDFCSDCWERDDDDNICLKDGRKFTDEGEEIKEG